MPQLKPPKRPIITDDAVRPGAETPIEACRFDATVAIVDVAGKTKPVTIFARSGEPIEHWYFGRIVHDMAGMQLDKGSIPIDYCHCPDEILGFGDQFDAQPDGLTIKGQLVPFQDDDTASEIIYKAALGVPYQASIYFDPVRLVLEQVGDQMSVEVNGYEFQGPGVIARKWILCGVAIVPNGADASSEVELSARRSAQNTSLSQTQEAAMAAKATDTTPTTPAPAEVKPAETTPTTPAPETTATTPAPETQQVDAGPPAPAGVADTRFAALGKKFLDAFGEQGGTWFAQGKSFDEAQTLFAAKTLENEKKKDEQIAALKTQLSKLRGEPEPVSFQSEQTAEQKRAAQLAATGISDNFATIAAGIKLPGGEPQK